MAVTLNKPEDPMANHKKNLSQEEGDSQKETASPSLHDTGGRGSSDDLSHHQHYSTVTASPRDTPRRAHHPTTRPNAGSADHSPLHPHYKAKVGTKGNELSSSSWERKVSSDSSHGLAPSTPGIIKLKSPAKGNETTETSVSIPKFGEWNDRDPSAVGFTEIFNRVREERQGGPGTASASGTDNHPFSRQSQYNNKKGCCCFPWGRN